MAVSADDLRKRQTKERIIQMIINYCLKKGKLDLLHELATKPYPQERKV